MASLKKSDMWIMMESKSLLDPDTKITTLTSMPDMATCKSLVHVFPGGCWNYERYNTTDTHWSKSSSDIPRIFVPHSDVVKLLEAHFADSK